MTSPYGLAALTTTDAGVVIDPAVPEDWDEWVSASKTRNWLGGDPLLDWLDRYGREHGFVPDDDLDGYDPRTDFRQFVFEQGHRFEDGVIGLIRAKLSTVRIGSGWRDARDLERAVATIEAMRSGVPVIEQAVLRNPENRTYGIADLLVRSDYLDQIVPGSLGLDAARHSAPGIDGASWHYRVVDIKFRTLDLRAGGEAGTEMAPYMAQVWVYNEALGRIQGYTPDAAYLLGRAWQQGKERGSSCFERLAPVNHDRTIMKNAGATIAQSVGEGLDWVRRLRREGGGWDVLPRPSVPELYPHARNHQDQPWHMAKAQIAERLAELTLLPGMNPERRRAAHAREIWRWDDPQSSATTLVIDAEYANQCDAVLAVNRDDPDLVVAPERIGLDGSAWRTPTGLEFYVDFETVSNLADDFSSLPQIGGQALIFQIGCGRWEDGSWRFEQWTVDRIREADEAVMIDHWIGHMDRLRIERGLIWSDVRIVHWSPAESSNLGSAYNSARHRHRDRDWPVLPWFDFLVEVREAPVAVRGAFGFGLKGIAKGLHAAGLIETTWGDGPTDGLGAMVGAWWCDGEAARVGGSMGNQLLMQEIGAYNEVDCRSMAEVVRWLRLNR